MQPSYSGNAADHYLVQKVNSSTPEQVTILLLEGGQRFLAQAIDAVNKRDIPFKSRMVNKVSAIVEELTVRLNYDDGGELVANLSSLYDWWIHEIFEASQKNQADRLQVIFQQMGEIKSSWQELERRQTQEAGTRATVGTEGMVG